MDNDTRVLEALVVTASVIGSDVPERSLRALEAELRQYPVESVLGALARCKVECKYRLSLADVIERLSDGHPGPDEAWELVPKGEADTSVVTDEIMAAIPFDLLDAGDMTAARMAFRETYRQAISVARAERRPAKWFATLGTDQRAREAPLLKAAQLGRLTATQLERLLPAPAAGHRLPSGVSAAIRHLRGPR